jgi:hypothetical protein
MSEQEKKLDGPDFARGVPLEDLAEGSMILGQAAGEAVVLARAGGALFAIGAECTHYHGPLAEGMLVQPPSSMGSVPESRVRNDSPLEGAVSSEPVSEMPISLVTGKNTGNPAPIPT